MAIASVVFVVVNMHVHYTFTLLPLAQETKLLEYVQVTEFVVYTKLQLYALLFNQNLVVRLILTLLCINTHLLSIL